MISFSLLVAATIASTPLSPLAESANAIAAGRFDQARLLVGQAIAQGARGEPVDRALADLAYASGKDVEALGRYRLLLLKHPHSAVLHERAGLAAMRLGDTARADTLLNAAVTQPGASWRAWNALGALADRRADWSAADRDYAEAERLSPGRAEVVNNIGWSLLLRGSFAEAEAQLAKAAELDPQSARIRNNHDLAAMALDAALPAQAAGEDQEHWAARLNDAGVAASLSGDKPRAIAAFSRAIETSQSWYARAFANLQRIEGAQ